MRPIHYVPLLALALGATILPSLSRGRDADPGLTGHWFSDVTGETVEFTRKSATSAEVKFASIGNATLTGTDEKGANLKLSFKSGLMGMSSTDCYYTTVKFGRDRMGWTVIDGPAACPRGSFTRLDNAKDVAMATPPRESPLPPQPQPEAPATNAPEPAGRPVRSVEQIAGIWTNTGNNNRIVIKRGFERGYEFWDGKIGKGQIAPTGDTGTYRVSFATTSCVVDAKIDRDQLSFDTVSGDRGCGLSGLYARGE